MSFKLKIICISVAVALLLGAVAVCFATDLFGIREESSAPIEETAETESETETEESLGATVTETKKSFFESVFFMLDVEKEEYINEYYDKLPRSMNYYGLLSRTSALYKNIYGKRVIADAYYCGEGESFGSSETAVGILLYYGIIYKYYHPSSDVSISFTAADLSRDTAVCVTQRSRYYGYVRSLDNKDYDENGFIRISFMLVEAAKMGIDVTVVSQSGADSDFSVYMKESMWQSCYDKYAKGKQVSDKLSFKAIDWSEDGAGDALGLTALTVSAYIDRYSGAYENAVFLSGGGLEGVNERGERENACSGITVTGHGELYGATKNFIELLSDCAEGSFDEFKNELNDKSAEQIALIAKGKEESIPQDEQIVWLGDSTDNVFRLCFSCGGLDGGAYESYAKEFESFSESANNYPDEHRVLILDGSDGAISPTVSSAISSAFVENRNEENRLSVTLPGYADEELSSLDVGKDIAYRCLNGKARGAEETLLSYLKDGSRKFVSLITSPMSGGASEQRIDLMLSVAENETVGDRLFMALGAASDGECVKEEGLTFSGEEIYYQTHNMNTLPQTFEAVIELNEGYHKTNYSGMLLSKSDGWNSQVTYEVMSNGNPRVSYMINEFVPDENREHGDHYKITTVRFRFDKVTVKSNSPIHLTIIHDREKEEARCYINGVLKQTLKQSDVLTEEQVVEGVPPLYDFPTVKPFVIGGNYLGGNGQYFRGIMKSLSLWADVRSKKEIASDVKGKTDLEDKELLCAYDFSSGDGNALKDLSANGNDIVCEKLWQNVDEVEAVEDFAYSFAMVGDIQVLCEKYFNDHYKNDTVLPNDPYDDIYKDDDVTSWDNSPEYINRIISWLIANKEKEKIEYVMTLGDLTQQSYPSEWEYVKKQIYRLNGEIPFSLAAGNHDRLDPALQEMTEHGFNVWPEERLMNAYFHKAFNDEVYRAQIDGSMYSWDVANTYNAFTVGEIKYLLITLDYGASDSMLEWANGIVEQYPDHRVIVTTHAYLYRDGTTCDAYDTYAPTRLDGGYNDGDDIWEKFISKHENIVMVLSGHDPCDSIIYTRAVGDKGNTVSQFLIDPQGMDYYMTYCTGMVAMFYFSEDGNTVTVRYYSTALNRFGNQKSQFTFTLGE